MHIDSNSSKELMYDRTNLYDENNYSIYFIDTNSIELNNKLKAVDIDVLSYIIDDKKYYARDINDLTNKYLKDKSLQEKIYYETNGFKIDGINVVAENNELLKLEHIIDIY